MTTTRKILANAISILIPLMVVSGSAYSWTDTVGVGEIVIGETVTPETLPNGDIRNEQHVYGTVKDSVLVGNGNGNSSSDRGAQVVYAGGSTENITVNSGGWQFIEGGTATGSIVNDKGYISLYSGSLIGAVVNAGGMVIAIGGEANDITVNNNGRFDVYGNYLLDNIVVNGATFGLGSTSMVTGNAQLNDWSIAGKVTVFDNEQSVVPVFTRADVLDGGTLSLYAGGQLTDSTVNGGNLYVAGYLAAGEGSFAQNTIMNSGVINVSNRGKLEATTVNGGALSVKSGGTATSTTVNGGSMTNIEGLDIDTVINGGSYYMVESELSVADNLTVNEAGAAYIGNGTLTDATVNGVMFAGFGGHSSVLKGDINIGSSGKLDVAYNSGNNTGEASLNITGDVFLTNNTLEADATFNFDNVTLQGGNISFGHANEGEFTRLNLESLDGSGTFWMNTDIARLCPLIT